MDVQNATEAALQKAEGTITEEAERALTDWIKTASRQEYEDFADACALAFPQVKMDDSSVAPPEQVATAYDSFCRQLGIGEYNHRRARVIALRWNWAAAIVLVVFIMGVTYRIMRQQPVTDPGIVMAPLEYQPPTIILESQGKTEIVVEGEEMNGAPSPEFVTLKMMDTLSMLRLRTSLRITSDVEGMNYVEVSVPPGERYELQLPDGTRVWLNAQSMLRYPFQYGLVARKVWLEGEAFFDVAKKEMPFEVVNEDMELWVLGTRFNMRRYADDRDLMVTLLEGSVRVKTPASSELLTPGQQAMVNNEIRIREVDTAYVTAWMRGLFHIRSANRYQIMKELEHWYGIKVAYSGMVSPHEFSVKASRQLTLESMLTLLDKGGIKTELKGDTVTVIR